MKIQTIHEASELPFKPRIDKITPTTPCNPYFRTIYGAEVEDHGRDDVAAFETHGLNMRHAAECAGLLDPEN